MKRLILGLSAVLILRCLGIAWQTLSHWDLYRHLETAGAPTFRVALYAALGLGGGFVWWQKRGFLWAWLAVYAIVDALWVFLYVQSDFDRGRLPFFAVTSGGLAGLIWWLRQKKLFGEKHDNRA